MADTNMKSPSNRAGGEPRRDSPQVTICIPHWEVRSLITVCLRSIRKHSSRYNPEVLVVDNGSKDESLDYLRSLPWIRLIERPEESPANWPLNVFTAWDEGIRQANGEFFVTMHSDVFVCSDDWLDPFLSRITESPTIGGVGAWKLEVENRLYALQKRLLGHLWGTCKRLTGKQVKRIEWRQGHYPRDYCAMYRVAAIRQHELTFRPIHGSGGGYSIAKQLWDHGYRTSMIPVPELARHMVHIAHGTAGINQAKPLHHRKGQQKAEAKTSTTLAADWIQALQADSSLDG